VRYDGLLTSPDASEHGIGHLGCGSTTKSAFFWPRHRLAYEPSLVTLASFLFCHPIPDSEPKYFYFVMANYALRSLWRVL